MKIGRLRKATSIWRRLSFMGNICKMRKSMMSYLTEEGLKCELVDGEVAFEFCGSNFSASFSISDNYAECTIGYCCKDEDYKKLGKNDKALVANRVNTVMENRATVYAFKDRIEASTSYYFTSKKMMIDLFSKHFEDLTASLNEAMDMACAMMDKQKKVRSRRIGFYTETIKSEDADPGQSQVAAIADM